MDENADITIVKADRQMTDAFDRIFNYDLDQVMSVTCRRQRGWGWRIYGVVYDRVSKINGYTDKTVYPLFFIAK